MSKEQKIAKENCIVKFRVGSHLYGTNIKTSDEDFEALFIEPPDYVIGRRKFKEVDMSTNKTNERNKPDDVDFKYYTVSNFLSLVMTGNPNKVEWLFIPDEHIIIQNEKYWNMIKEARDLILSTKIKHSFAGYAASQKKKLLTKKQRYDELVEFKKLLEENIKKGAKKIGNLDAYEIVKHKKYDRDADKIVTIVNKRIKGNLDHIKYYQTDEGADAIKIGEKIYNYGMDVEKIYQNVCKEVNKYGHRTKHLEEYGFDIKFGMHLFRLYYEGMELFTTGKITFPSPNKDYLLEIRKGKYSLDELIEKSDQFDEDFKKLKDEDSPLRKSPDQEALHKLQIKIYTEYWKEKGLL